MDLNQYIETVSKRYQSGISREHAYRADLEALIRALVIDVEITNEPANVTDCGNPDYVITKKNIPIGFIEAKDVGKDLNSKQYKPQFDRYRKALDNLIITDYIRFQFYQYGQLVHEIRIAEIEHEQVVACPDSFAEFTMLVQNFCTYVGQTIRSSKKLAGMMAAKAHLLQIILEKAITSDEQTQDNTAIQQQFNTFKDILIHDLTPAGFADIYAQTLAYGMFAARLNDQTLDTFSRQEAAELIPKSNPFLRKLFAHVAGVDIDERIRVTVDNPTFRGMRWNLLKTFDKIYTIDLHGNSKKKETAPDGSKDVNVFDIMQGVAITFFIKKKPIHAVTPATPQGGLSCTSAIHLQAGVQTTPMDSRLRGNDEGLAEVHHFDLYGERKAKYEFLLNNSLSSIAFNKLSNVAPMYFMVKKNFEAEAKYNTGFSVPELFPVNVMGFQTHRDHFAIAFTRSELERRVTDMRDVDIDDEFLRQKYNLRDNRDWQLSKARKQASSTKADDVIRYCSYRPFDTRPSYFSYEAMDYPRRELIDHVAGKDNLCLNICRQTKAFEWKHILVSGQPTPAVFVEIKDGSSAMPLYLYPESDKQQVLGESLARKPNLDAEIVEAIAEGLSLDFVPEKNPPQSPFAKGEAHVTGEEIAPLLEKEGQGEICQQKTFAPIDLLDYIYAVLHSPSYRKIYKEFLKIDFPRIPYPKDTEVFWQLVKLGGELRQVHLLESATVENFITSYPQGGDNVVTRKIVKKDWEVHPVRHTREGGYPSSETMPESMDSRLRGNDDVVGRIWINDEQYFDQIPLTAWGFYIGGYQPAQKWLKDRSGRKLSYDDILHYQKIIVALTETDRLMQEINRIDLSSS